MVYIPGVGYIGSPQDLLSNPWMVFIGIFLITFGIVYFSLSKFFSSKHKADWREIIEGKGDKIIAHPSALIISLVIALFTAASVSQYGPFYDYFRNILGGWIVVLSIILMFFVAVVLFDIISAFVKFLGGRTQTTATRIFAGVVAGFLLWFIIKYSAPSFFNSASYYGLPGNIPYVIDNTLTILMSPAGIFILIGVCIGLAFWRMRK